ncbi:hypothetical protein ABW21_db0206353 [Orbilia brochopaga]|nr:hypothetical protein ABW21_db0206353 [Drechslerella brochopaga]
MSQEGERVVRVSGTNLELPDWIDIGAVALSVASAIRSQDQKAKLRRGNLSWEALTDLEMHLCQIHLHAKSLRSRQNEFAECLEQISIILDGMLDGNYIQRYLNDSPAIATSLNSLQYTRPSCLLAALISEPPPKFDAVEAIHIDVSSGLSNLLPLLRKVFGMPHAGELARLCKARELAEGLHRILHQHWPCQLHLNVNDHDGKLGACTRASLQLDPRWISGGVKDDTFFVILTGTLIKQECKIRVHLSERIIRDTDGEPVCFLPYDECKECCLSLVSDTSHKLWEDPDAYLDLQLHVRSDLRFPAKYELLTLRKLLQCLEPTYSAKRVVSMILSRALLVLLNGEWVGAALSMDDIYVFCKLEDHGPRPFFDKVFLSTHFGPAIHKPALRRVRNQHNRHPFPAIQALGILVAEIELGNRLDSIYRNIPPKARVQSPDKVAEILFEECRKRLRLDSGVLHTIEFCIEKNSLKKFEDGALKAPLQENNRFVKKYYDNIVRPLEEDLVDGAKWSWDEVNWQKYRELDYSGIAMMIGNPLQDIARQPDQIQERKGNQTPVVTFLREERGGAPFTPSLVGMTEPLSNQVFDAYSRVVHPNDMSRSRSANDWFNELKAVHACLSSDRMGSLDEEELEEQVKVAIIDTGIDLNHPAFQEFRKSRQLDPGIDFVDKGEEIRDLDGHGTHVCHTLLKTAPYAKAIYYAIETLDVDIISMSFAFEQVESDIKDALYNAKSKTSKNVLMFAAASNNRALKAEPIGYPARATDRVICVNSSTANDERSSFSPPGEPGLPNFSVVGEDVEAAWPPDKMRAMSGTSSATPIVAGIAALLLDFAKKDIGQASPPKWDTIMKKELSEMQGMKSVLKKCMTDMKTDGSYNLIKPWKLLKEEFSTVAERIIEALDRKHIWGY